MREIVLASAIALTAVCAVVPRVMAQQDSTTQMNVYYDEYQPSGRRRLRRESCAQDENESGIYCIKKCEGGFVAVANVKPPLCRSVDPLPPGKTPSAVRVQTGTQPVLADAPAYKPAPAPPRAGKIPDERSKQ